MSSTTVAPAALPDEARADGTRRRILLAGLELFAERGFHAASIRDIATRAGVGSASLYSHFASKEAILAELVLLGTEVHHRLLVTELLDAGTDPRDQLAALVRAHVRSHATYPLLGRVADIEMGRLSPTAAAPAMVLRERSRQLLDDVLQRGIDRGVLAVVDLEVTRVAIVTMGGAVAGWYPAHRDRITVDQLADRYATLVLRMAGASVPVH